MKTPSLINILRAYLPFTKHYSIEFLDKAFLESKKHYYNLQAPEVIYGFWTEDNPLTKNRKNAIQSIKENCTTPFKLITKNDLPKYELIEHPFHPSFPYLSAVHKADYLRTYFMHFYGGGYTDIKPHSNSWSSLFKTLNENTLAIAIGYPEGTTKNIAYVKDFISPPGNKRKINRHLKQNYNKLIGNGSYIFKPRTIFTKLWLYECERRLSLSYEALKNNPGNLYGNNPGYPLPWNSILGQIFHPLCMAFKDSIMTSDKICPIFINYR